MEKKPTMEERRIKETGSSTEDGNKEDDSGFPGFRFHPTDQELVGFYLKRKVERKCFSIDIIKEMDIYKHDPWDLPSEARPQGEREWFFFCLRGRKYRNSIRPNRVTGSGFWKATGIDKPIRDGGEGVIGLKKSLVYYRGSAGRGTKTEWMMHEFRQSSSFQQDAEIWTICRIFKRNLSYNRRFQQQQQTKQEHYGGNNRRSHQEQQLNRYCCYYYGYHQHQHPYTDCASSIFNESTTTDVRSEVHHAATEDHRQPFLLQGFHGASLADETKTKTKTKTKTSGTTTGTSPPPSASASASAWSELTICNTWDELGRILELSTPPRIRY